MVDKIGRRPVVLVGMMGVGKTTVGRRLAPRLGLAFKDADEEIEKAAGMPVADLFEAHGEAQFRRGETQVIERLLGEGPAVIATGGGAMANAETRTLIRARSFSIWLHAGLDTIVRRATRRNTRPLLRSGDPAATIAKLLNDRAPHYATADVAVESPEGPHGRTVDAIIRALDARAADHANGVDRS
ncbi:MAG: shikimate kinase [Parvularculaceae bacterium]